MDEIFKEKLKEKLTHPILAGILVLAAIGSTVFYGVSISIVSDKKETVNNLDIQSVKKDNDGNVVVTMNDKAASIDEAYEQAKTDLKNAANGETVNTDKITKFFEVRYNYDGKEKDSAESVTEKLKSDCTENYLKNIKEDMEKSKDEDGCSCTVNQVYINGVSSDSLNSYESVIYYCYDVTIDGKRQLQKVTLKPENGSWVISGTEKITDLEG